LPTPRGAEVYLHRIHHGSKLQKREHIVYASLSRVSDSTLIISATLDYCLSAVRERGFVLVPDPRNS
jgi:hypothetical protein